MCEAGSLPGIYSDTQTCDDLNGESGLLGECLFGDSADQQSTMHYYGAVGDCGDYSSQCADDGGTWTAGPVCQGGSGGESGTGGGAGAGAGGQGGSG